VLLVGMKRIKRKILEVVVAQSRAGLSPVNVMKRVGL